MKDIGKTKEQLISRPEDIHQQMTGFEQAKTKYWQVEELYEAIVNSSPVGIYIFQDKRLCFVNSQFQEHSGYGEEELLGMNPAELVYDEDRQQTREKAVEMLKGKRRTPYEFRIVRKDGKLRWAMETVSSIQYQGKRATLGNFMDITEYKRTEEALRESEERYSALVDLGSRIGEAIIMLQDTKQKQAIHTFVNDEWPNITGYSREELLKMSFYDLVHPKYREASLQRHHRKISGEVIPELFEMSIVNKQGKEIPIEITSAYTTYKGESATAVFIRNTTDRKQVEKRLLDYQHRLRSLAAQLSLAEEHERHLIATGLHDNVSQSLAICNIKLGALLQQSPCENFSKQIKELRALMSTVIQETRSLSFSISSPLLYEFGLDAAIEKLAGEIQEQYGLKVRFRAAKNLQSLDNDIRVLLFRLVREIFTNTLKHAEAHQINVLMKQFDDCLKIIIEDDGIGFDAAPYIGKKKKARGFGLFSVRERLRYIGGSLEVESQRGVGTKVTLTTPMNRESKNTEKEAVIE